MTDDTVLEEHNEDPALVQMKLIGDGGKFSLTTLLSFISDLVSDWFVEAGSSPVEVSLSHHAVTLSLSQGHQHMLHKLDLLLTTCRLGNCCESRYFGNTSSMLDVGW